MRLARNHLWTVMCRAAVLVAAVLVGTGLAMPATSAFAQLDLTRLEGNIGRGASVEPVKVRAEILPAERDQPAMLAVTADIRRGYHIYSLTQRGAGPRASAIKIASSPKFKLGPFTPAVEPDKQPEPAFDNLLVESHHDQITWTAPIRTAAGTNVADLQIDGELAFQACDANSCLAPTSLPFTAALAGADGNAEATAGKPAASARADGRKLENSSDHTMAVSAVFSAGIDGKPAMLYVTAKLAPGWHTFSVTQPSGGPKKTTIKLASPAEVKLLGEFEPVVAADIEYDEVAFAGVPLEVHHDEVTWRAPVELPADADLAELLIAGDVNSQRCQEQTCLPPKKFRFTAIMADEPTIADLVSSAPDKPDASTGSGTYKTVVKTPTSTLKIVQFLGMALVGGLILNFMPCVLPVIGLKIMGFVQQSGDDRGRILKLNLWFTAGLISIFMGLATLAVGFGFGWGEQFTSLWFNIALASLVFVMALSFLGVWEIPIPGFVGTGKANELTQREGAQGAFFKGMITTLLATPCSGPLLGPVFGFTLGQSAWLVYAIFFCVGLGMASPYLAIGAFPGLIRFLPRPGVWMDTFKHAMGFVMLGAVVFLLMSVGEKYLLAVVGFLFGLWAAFWWIGRTPLTAAFQTKARAWMGGAIIAGAVAIASFNLLVSGEELLPWQPYSQSKLEQLAEEKKTVLVEFTADWCLTCQVNLKTAINRAAVADLVKDNEVVTLKADWTEPSEEIKAMLARLGSNSIPILAVFPADRPDEPIILPDLITQNQVLEALKKAGPSQKSTARATAMAAPLSGEGLGGRD